MNDWTGQGLQTVWISPPSLHVTGLFLPLEEAPDTIARQFKLLHRICSNRAGFLEVTQLCFPFACLDLSCCHSVHLEGPQSHLRHFRISLFKTKYTCSILHPSLIWTEVTSGYFSLAPALDHMLIYLVDCRPLVFTRGI